MPREQIWKNSELLSMDKLLEFDEKQEEEKVLEPEPPKPVEPEFQKQRRPVQNGFNANEALGLLLNIQRSSDDTKFDLIDGFLDKYKVIYFMRFVFYCFFRLRKSPQNQHNSKILASHDRPLIDEWLRTRSSRILSSPSRRTMLLPFASTPVAPIQNQQKE